MEVISNTQQVFISPSKGKLSITAVVTEIVAYLAADPGATYRLVIGSDSHDRTVDGDKLANFVSAIVVHRIGKGGRYFWQNGLKLKTHSIREKIYQETSLSLKLASKLVPLLNQKLNGSKNWELEIHIDVGRSGPTRDMIKEVVGMVVGSGYVAKTKPDSYAASTVADKHT